MKAFDKFSHIAGYGRIVAAIFGNLETQDYELIDVDAVPLSEAQAAIQTRGLAFIGVMGLMDGKPRTALDVELDEETGAALSHAYVQFACARLSKPKGDSADWLRRLFALPDTRAN